MHASWFVFHGHSLWLLLSEVARTFIVRLEPVHRTPSRRFVLLALMGIDAWDHEGNALAVYREAGADPHEPPGPHTLARHLGITIRYERARLLGGAAFAVLDGAEYIFVRRGLSPLVEGMKIYHELAERHLRAARGEEQHERACDELAYHLRMPRAAFRELLGAVGCDLAALAEPWPATQTAAAIRYLEVTGVPGVVLTPKDARQRGEWVWPPLPDLRRLARAGRLPDGVEAVAIGDRAGSVLLLAS